MMNAYQQEQVKEKARADFARSPALQAEFETPEPMRPIRPLLPVGASPAKPALLWSPTRPKPHSAEPGIQCRNSKAEWPGGFEEAFRAHMIAESARCAPGLHTTANSIYARSGQ